VFLTVGEWLELCDRFYCTRIDVFHDYSFRCQFFIRQAVHACLRSFMSQNGSHCEFIAKETSSNLQMPAVFIMLR
jgi:hypothetical protein